MIKMLCCALLSVCIVHTVNANQITPTNMYIYSTLSRLNSNDTLMLPAGIYQLSTTNRITGKTNVAVISRDGPGKAVLIGSLPSTVYESLIFESCTTVTIKGIELRQSGDNLLKIGGCKDVLIEDCYIHNASNMGDCIKITRDANNTWTEDLRVLRTIVHTPGHYTSSEWEECLDMINVRNALVQDCWFFNQDTNGNQLSYPKGGCEDIVYDRCLFGPTSTLTWDPAVGGGYGAPASGYNCNRETIRNCVFFTCRGGAVASFDIQDFWIYNNTFINCASRTINSPQYLGIIHVKHGGGMANSDRFYIYNNVFYNAGSATAYAMCVQGVTATNINHSNNAYYNLLSDLNYASNIYNWTTETNRVTTNPYAAGAPNLPTLPTVTISSHTWAQLDSIKKLAINRCRIVTGSSVIDQGIAANATPYPNVTTDIEGFPRPYNSTYDIGAYEYDPAVAIEGRVAPAVETGLSAAPNPFNPSVNITFNRPGTAVHTLRIYSIDGTCVADLTSQVQSNAVLWRPGTLASGIYIIKASAGNAAYVKTVIFSR